MKNIIMLHGRGSSREDMLSFSRMLPKANYIALQAPTPNRSWYPNSFLVTKEANEPYITNAMNMINNSIKEFDPKTVIILGFSQGACLATEFALRFPKRYAGFLIFSGGYIGNVIRKEIDLKETPVFIGCSDDDPYIPLERVNETIKLFQNSNSNLSYHVYEGNSHTITDKEVEYAIKMITG